MRPLALSLAAPLVLALASCASAQDASGPPDQQPRIQTPGDYGHSNVEHAAEAPLHDLNITRQKIPPVLAAAIADPYARVPMNCRAIYVRIADLTEALGPDFDQRGPPPDASTKAKAKPTALSLMHGAAESLLPFSSYISTLSGAQRHDALITLAINAGSVRRGYLKGLGEAIGCRPPDSPIHLAWPAPPVQVGRRRPLYPVN
ncbi:MAG: hypothetical protein ACRED8_13945 [Caulobacteraceae bacterium]